MQNSPILTGGNLTLPPAAERSGSPFLEALKSGRGIISKDNRGRPFTYFTRDSFMAEIRPLLEEVKVKRIWIPVTKDALGRETKWLNILFEPK